MRFDAVERGIMALGAVLLILILAGALAGCASGPNEKPRWKAYSLEVRP